MKTIDQRRSLIVRGQFNGLSSSAPFMDQEIQHCLDQLGAPFCYLKTIMVDQDFRLHKWRRGCDST